MCLSLEYRWVLTFLLGVLVSFPARHLSLWSFSTIFIICIREARPSKPKEFSQYNTRSVGSKRRHLDDLQATQASPVLFEFSKGQFVRDSLCTLEAKDPFMSVRRQRPGRLAPKGFARFDWHKPYHALWFLQVDDNNVNPRALTRPREQIRPTVQRGEQTREEFLRVQTCEFVHELLPYLAYSGDPIVVSHA